jgi:hypothetical protein
MKLLQKQIKFITKKHFKCMGNLLINMISMNENFQDEQDAKSHGVPKCDKKRK